ncbi:MAG: prepilin-type N-terminal cleavage/methylation domain-containing protein [Syntrophales bacterium]
MNNRGYTLIELSVVVLLIGLMLLIAVPRVRDTLFDDDLKAATRRFISSARELRNEAVREQTDYILHVDLTNPAFWVYPADTTAEKRSELRKGAFRLPEGVRIAGIRQADEERRTEGEALIHFFRRGYVEPTVLHLAAGDRVFTLVFNPFLPAMTVYENYVDFTFNREEHAAGF